MKDHHRMRAWFEGEYWDWSPASPEYLYSKELARMEAGLVSQDVLGTLNEAFPIWESCTGLKDKTGRLIFEGDICRSYHFTGPRNKKNYLFHEVYYNDLWAGFHAKSPCGENDTSMFVYHRNAEDIEIIGNIHTNPELLKG